MWTGGEATELYSATSGPCGLASGSQAYRSRNQRAEGEHDTLKKQDRPDNYLDDAPACGW